MKHAKLTLVYLKNNATVRKVCVCYGLWNPPTASLLKSEEEGLVKKTLSNILNLDCNTYSILHTAPLISHWNYNSTKNKSAVNQSKLSFPQISSPPPPQTKLSKNFNFLFGWFY